MRRLALLTLTALALAGCEPPEALTKNEGVRRRDDMAAPFVHVLDGDQSGYYLPLDEARADGWTFHHLFTGQEADFEAWEAGRRSRTFAPLMIEFEDQNSPMVATELGESRSGRDRILPTRYRITDRRVVFEGRSERLGEVSFDGRIDPNALAEAKRNLGDEGAVVTGTLKVGGRSFNNVRLRWWAGD